MIEIYFNFVMLIVKIVMCKLTIQLKEMDMLLKNKYYMTIVLLLLAIAIIISFNKPLIANPVFERIFYILLSIDFILVFFGTFTIHKDK
ncbi:hypothetical protein CD158_04045 [Staphylococcus auricularis]|uniref:Uncharacterized protein n=1 Tax=Staphylococcus auricularis TaxID=29379 RepID=A0AAP8TTI1_9STAP|nr:hypothetical protein CD158_04045 [Staphylococcus auricularis]